MIRRNPNDEITFSPLPEGAKPEEMIEKILSGTKKVFVTVRTSFEGLHYWPNAPEGEFFLRHLHRHLFGVRVKVEVIHEDRAVEFFSLQKELNVVLCDVQDSLKKLPSQSCEHLADLIGRRLIGRGYRIREVEVDEDGENSASIEYDYE